jgi:hypothetical protein
MNGKTLPKRTEWGILLFKKEDVRKGNNEPMTGIDGCGLLKKTPAGIARTGAYYNHI